MSKITPRMDDIVKDLELAKEEIDKVDPERYPSFLDNGKIRQDVASIKAVTDDGVSFANEAKPLIKVLPQLLGEPTEKKYLVLFQNDKELRPTGGFLTAYAIFRVDQGLFMLMIQAISTRLMRRLAISKQRPGQFLQYLANVPVLNLRDTNLSPTLSCQ